MDLFPEEAAAACLQTADPGDWPVAPDWQRVVSQFFEGAEGQTLLAFLKRRIGAGAVVNKDVKPYALMVGVPAKQVGWMSEYGEQIPLPIQGDGQYTCPHTGQLYNLSQDQLKRQHP